MSVRPGTILSEGRDARYKANTTNPRAPVAMGSALDGNEQAETDEIGSRSSVKGRAYMRELAEKAATALEGDFTSPVSPPNQSHGRPIRKHHDPEAIQPHQNYYPVPSHRAADSAASLAPIARSLMVRTELEYYFGIENLCHDIFLRRNMDSEGFVCLDVIARFKQIKTLTSDLKVLERACDSSDSLEIRRDELGMRKVRRREGWEQWVLPKKERIVTAQLEIPSSKRGTLAKLEAASTKTAPTFRKSRGRPDRRSSISLATPSNDRKPVMDVANKAWWKTTEKADPECNDYLAPQSILHDLKLDQPSGPSSEGGIMHSYIGARSNRPRAAKKKDVDSIIQQELMPSFNGDTSSDTTPNPR